MYHKEKVIDGVLHVRSTPDSEWVALTARQLTDRLLDRRPTGEERA